MFVLDNEFLYMQLYVKTVILKIKVLTLELCEVYM